MLRGFLEMNGGDGARWIATQPSLVKRKQLGSGSLNRLPVPLTCQNRRLGTHYAEFPGQKSHDLPNEVIEANSRYRTDRECIAVPSAP